MWNSAWTIKNVNLIYQEEARLQACSDNKEHSLIEAKLAWMVHIVAAIIKLKHFRLKFLLILVANIHFRESTLLTYKFTWLASFSGESQEVFDAELSARVFLLLNVTDSGLHSQVCKLEYRSVSCLKKSF